MLPRVNIRDGSLVPIRQKEKIAVKVASVNGPVDLRIPILAALTNPSNYLFETKFYKK